jgi:hypothetical protein
MAQVSDVDLKKYFETGDKPTQQQFANFIDSKRSVLDKILVADLHQDILDLLNGGSDTIYTADGTLQGNRTIDGDGYDLYFYNLASFNVLATQVDINTDNFNVHSPNTLFEDTLLGIEYVTANAEQFKKTSFYNGKAGDVFFIDSTGALVVKTFNDNIGAFQQRFSISGVDDYAMASIMNANFEVKDNGSNTWLQTDLVNQILVLGDVDNAYNGTKIIVSDTAQQVLVNAQGGFAIHASDDFFSNTFQAVLKTDNLIDGDTVLQLPLANNKTLVASIDGYAATPNGNINIANEANFTPTVSNASNATFNQSSLRYLKVRDTVIVHGFIECSTAVGSTFGSFNFTLPFNTTINNAGGASAVNNAYSNNVSSISIEINSASNYLANVKIYSPLGGQKKYYFTLTYKI